MTDTPNQIKNKINRHGFSGGGDTEELHRQNGGNPDVDVAFQYLSFYEEDDELLTKTAAVSFASCREMRVKMFITQAFAQDYRAGTLLTGQLKAMCIKKLQEEVKDFQEVRIRTDSIEGAAY